jgi:tetratricopeptide (TPR) repeat protein
VTVRDRHLTWGVDLVEQAEPVLEGLSGDYTTALDRLVAEQENLRAALHWSQERDPIAGLRLAGALGEFWRERRLHREGGQWLEALLAAAPGQSLARARALFAAGRLWREYGDLARAKPLLTAALALYEDLGDRHGMARTLTRLGMVVAAEGDHERASALHERGLALARDLQDRFTIAVTLHHQGMLAIRRDEHARARVLEEEAAALWRALGRTGRLWVTLAGLSRLAQREGDIQRARALLEEGQSLLEVTRHHDPVALPFIWTRLGDLARVEGDFAGARRWYRLALTNLRAIEWPVPALFALISVGVLAVHCGTHDRGARLLGASITRLESSSYPMNADERRECEGAMAMARAELSEAAFATAWAAGQALTVEQAAAEALAEVGGDG